ncbi:MAG: arginine--tRNA ligase [Oscillospiraceae bacterium]|nr:arginine--tRNA ligase [Oscillospiraceae bacterium]
MNLVAQIKEEISEIIGEALASAVASGKLAPVAEDVEIFVEEPKDKSNGDFSSNIAMTLAKPQGKAPRVIAQAIVDALDGKLGGNIEKIEIAGAGFLNFHLDKAWYYKTFELIDQMGEDYGKIDIGKGKTVMVEFVSANPTGPMHMGNARGGALGDCIAGVLEYAGYDVTREFYINDAGNQIEKLGLSLEARYIQQLKGADAIEFPEDGYHGEDISAHAAAFIKIHGDKYLDAPEAERRQALAEYALELNIANLKSGLEQYRIHYDVWFRESELYKSGELDETIKILTDNGHTYEQDGAIWLALTKFGLDKDEVLVRQNGHPTYFAADIAYHRNKFVARGFDMGINTWGADHHGHVARMKAALDAVGVDSEKLTVILFQLVRLMRDGEVVRMSKRTGKAITLSDLLEEAGVDVARFFFNMQRAGGHLDFDLSLAKTQSNENPVYYVQYAHARICSIIRQMAEDGITVPKFGEFDAAVLVEDAEIDLLRKICALPEEIRISAENLEPAKMTRYLMEIAALFHTFYNACRVKCDDEKLMKARLALIASAALVIRNVLTMLKVSAPEQM